jgi:hypothetical protein
VKLWGIRVIQVAMGCLRLYNQLNPAKFSLAAAWPHRFLTITTGTYKKYD